jgi:hypothetical protein
MRRIRASAQNDNDALNLLSESLPMQGRFSLRIDRKPDFFALLKERGLSSTFLSELDNQIDGCISISEKQYLRHGEPFTAYILSDLKFKTGGVGVSFYRLLVYTQKQLQDRNAETLFATIADGNAAVIALLSGRCGFPSFSKVSDFEVLQLLPKKSKRIDPVIQKSDHAMTEQILQCYHTFLTKFHIANIPSPLNEAREDEYYISRNNEVVAAIRLSDTIDLKQNVIIRCPLHISILLKLLAWFRVPLGLPVIPSTGSPVKLIYIRYFAYKEENIADFIKLIDYARHYTHLKGYTFLSLAMCSQLDMLEKVKKHFFHMTFKSSLWTASLSAKPLIDPTKKLCFEDFATV